ncbi:MAG: TonB-dependent receptor [Alphaproteobacteria bacterium]|nr:TonB-dependent receptor [Alphaproteobacteria bacterium]
MSFVRSHRDALRARPAAFRLALLAVTATAAAAAPPALADEPLTAPAVSILGTAPSSPAVSESFPADPTRAPWSDAGDYLRSLPGVSAGRMGGHGLEPVIRGLQQNQLTVLTDGVQALGACPNRMDPPTVYGAAEGADRIVVTRGYQSVLNGPGAPGGVVSLERDRPPVADDAPFAGAVGAGFDSNASARSTHADLAVGDDRAFARAVGAWKQAGNYEDGAGREVRSGFSDYSAGLTLGWTGDASAGDGAVEAGYDYTRIDDALFAGAGMDSPYSKSDALRLKMETPVDAGPVTALRLEAFGALVDHRMDNYSLRERTAGFRRAESGSDTVGFSLEADLDGEGGPLTLRLDASSNRRDATRYVGNTRATTTATNAILWPDIATLQAGLAAEKRWALDARNTLVIGARYDHVSVDWGRADRATDIAMGGVSTANQLYRRFYGVTADDVSEHNLGGLLRWEAALREGLDLSLGASRSVRTADATERGLANNMNLTSWVGNPAIDPEAHHQIEAGLDWASGRWSLGGALYANYVSDYIFRDSARSQRGVQITALGADVYTNIDALLAGGGLQAAFQASEAWRLTAAVDTIYGQNLSDDIPLAQTPPLEGALGAEWAAGDWTLGSRLRLAATQNRVDLDASEGSGRDIRKTPGHAVLDLYGGVAATDRIELGFGVTNLFDATYAGHLNRANALDNTEVQVNEPGRSFYLRVLARF